MPTSKIVSPLPFWTMNGARTVSGALPRAAEGAAELFSARLSLGRAFSSAARRVSSFFSRASSSLSSFS
jgi:hypothetical protein